METKTLRMTESVIHRVTTLDLKVRPRPWAFAAERRGEIDAHFAKMRELRPEIWNGRVLVGCNPRFTQDRFSAEYFETDFASFLAWRDWDFPDREVFNGFGMGALLSRDGAFVLGEMGEHTANAGRIYFPAGTPDPDDVKDGVLDIAGSITRETEEETGLTTADYTIDAEWDCVVSGRRVAMIRILRVDMPADRLRTRIENTIAGQRQPELRAVHLVRTVAELSPAMPPFVRTFIEARLQA
jgi:8-oxo-dGTP pyrophosphatase MutT (NUDIX family)